jgi:hypothetical protein
MLQVQALKPRERKEKIKEESQSSTNHWKLLYMRRPVRETFP